MGNNEVFSMRFIGECPKTIGELKKLIEHIDDGVSFGFRNMPALDLCELNYDKVKYIVFQWPLNEQENEK